MQKKSMLPLIIFDAVVNLYLTMLFVIPLRSELLPPFDAYHF
jgi:hypothetical protein